MKGTGSSADLSPRSLSFPEPILQTFSLVNPNPGGEKWGLFSILLSSWSCYMDWKKKHLAMFAMLPPVPTWETRTENLFKAMPPSASCLLFFCHECSTKDPKCKSPLSPFLVLQLYDAKEREQYMCACVCLCAAELVYTQLDCSLCICHGVRRMWGGEGLM